VFVATEPRVCHTASDNSFRRFRSRTNSFPSYPVNARDPSHVELSFENILFNTQADIRLHGWFIPHQEARATLVWFHGSAGNISDRLLNIKQLHDRIRINIFIFDYRGYGQSQETASEKGTYLDGESAIKSAGAR